MLTHYVLKFIAMIADNEVCPITDLVLLGELNGKTKLPGRIFAS